MVESQIEPEGDHPKALVRWDDGNYSVHHDTNFARLLLTSLACIRN